MKRLNNIVNIIVLIGLIIIGIAVITSIGYALYLWGATGAPFGFSIWSGFLLWLIMIATGGSIIALGLFTESFLIKRGKKY